MAEILVVASKVKDYIRSKSDGMNTSATFLDALSKAVQELCEKAIMAARDDGRKTVKDRDLHNHSGGCC
ncbi:MAG: hypothetical protein HYV02_04590 [Deltaproteobacteria bacterium]|nr:hypothetical protein [Deltaproteobacteria bacterium]